MLLQLRRLVSPRLDFPAAGDSVGHVHLEMLSHAQFSHRFGVPIAGSFTSSDPFSAGVAVLSLITPTLSRCSDLLLSSLQPLDFLTSPLGVLMYLSLKMAQTDLLLFLPATVLF